MQSFSRNSGKPTALTSETDFFCINDWLIAECWSKQWLKLHLRDFWHEVLSKIVLRREIHESFFLCVVVTKLSWNTGCNGSLRVVADTTIWHHYTSSTGLWLPASPRLTSLNDSATTLISVRLEIRRRPMRDGAGLRCWLNRANISGWTT